MDEIIEKFHKTSQRRKEIKPDNLKHDNNKKNNPSKSDTETKAKNVYDVLPLSEVPSTVPTRYLTFIQPTQKLEDRRK